MSRKNWTFSLRWNQASISIGLSSQRSSVPKRVATHSTDIKSAANVKHYTCMKFHRWQHFEVVEIFKFSVFYSYMANYYAVCYTWKKASSMAGSGVLAVSGFSARQPDVWRAARAGWSPTTHVWTRSRHLPESATCSRSFVWKRRWVSSVTETWHSHPQVCRLLLAILELICQTGQQIRHLVLVPLK